MKNKKTEDRSRYQSRPHRDDQSEFNLNINDDRKYHLDFEIIDLREQKRPERLVKTARKNLKKVILHRINGKIGEC
jgi:hypothetical protein